MAIDLQRLARTRHLSTPDFGPYPMTYAGLAHIRRADNRSVEFLPAFRLDGHAPLLPSHTRQNPVAFHAYNATADLSFFQYKFDLLGLDDVFALVDFFPTDQACDLRVRLINRTGQDRRVDLELAAVAPAELEPPPRLDLEPDERWLGGEDYDAYHGPQTRFTDGYRNMVSVKRGAVGGVAVSQGWGETPEAWFDFTIEAPRELPDAWLAVRYRRGGEVRVPHTLVFDAVARPLHFETADRWTVEWVGLGPIAAGRHSVRVGTPAFDRSGYAKDLYGHISLNIELDGLLLAPARREGFVRPTQPGQAGRPSAETLAPGRYAFALDGHRYGVAVGPGVEPSAVRLSSRPELYATAPDFLDNCAAVLGSVQIDRIDLPANGERTIALRVVCDAGEGLASLLKRPAATPADPPDVSAAIPPRFRFGYRLLASNVLMNVSYPVFTPSETIATYTPGKTWGGLYSWDAGMHGIGLLELAPEAAAELLNVYLCGPDEPNDFLLHGTPLPVQAYLASDLWSRRRDRELLAYLYPRLRRFYEHLVGRSPTSRTARFGNDLINTFPLFYNSGGWDDLPPQQAIHQNDLADRVTPVAPTAHLVRFARILRRFADELFDDAQRDAERARLDADIARSLAAIERTWDDDASVYSYVWHDRFEPFRHDSGANFNHTLDAMTPLICGGVAEERAERLWRQLLAPGRFLTAVGLSTVDQAAPYFRNDGYWNGAVWIPHQWFLFRAALDHARGEAAMLIARIVAETWQREALRRHCSFELFRIDTGLGAGYPHFAGLSSPVLAMVAALARAGTVTPGLDSECRNVQCDSRRLGFEVRTFADHAPEPARHAVLAVVERPGRYRLETNDGQRTVRTSDLGAVAIDLPRRNQWQRVLLERI